MYLILMDFDSDTALDNYKGYEFTDIIQVVKSQLEISSSVAIEKAKEGKSRSKSLHWGQIS